MITKNYESYFLLASARKMRHVQRLAGTPIIKPYTLAEHGFYVALLFKEICRTEDLEVTADDMEFCLLHDILETETGDLLYPAKHASPYAERSWDIIEQEVLKKHAHLGWYTDEHFNDQPEKKKVWQAADMLDLYLFCKEEQQLGNNTHPLRMVIDKAAGILLRSNIQFVTDLLATLAGEGE